MSYKPRGLTFDQFSVGDVFVCQARTVTEADTVNFAGVSGDYNPLHTDEEFGKATPFGTRIAHGVLGLAIATGQANQLGVFEGTTIALMQQTIKYVGAVKFGDTITTEYTITEIDLAKRRMYNQVTCTNQRGEVVASAIHLRAFVD